MNKRNHYSAEFKTKVVLEILSEESTINQIAAQYGISPVVLSRWKKEFLARISSNGVCRPQKYSIPRFFSVTTFSHSLRFSGV